MGGCLVLFYVFALSLDGLKYDIFDRFKRCAIAIYIFFRACFVLFRFALGREMPFGHVDSFFYQKDDFVRSLVWRR